MVVSRNRSTKANPSLHIKDDSVSERHALVSWTGTAWELRDVGSSNGTQVNGRKLRRHCEWPLAWHGRPGRGQLGSSLPPCLPALYCNVV
jgi:pSer/pThr/pTyr-binding forkhead associated (FHA) protein